MPRGRDLPRKIAASPAASTESAKGEGQSSAGTAAQSARANCKQEYAAKKAAGATEASGQASYLKACLTADPPPGRRQRPRRAAATSISCAKARKLRSPAPSACSSRQPQLGFTGLTTRRRACSTSSRLFRFHLNDDWNLITRWVRRSASIGLDLRPDASVRVRDWQSACRSSISGAVPPGEFIWGVGPPGFICDATDKTLGVNAWERRTRRRSTYDPTAMG